MVDAKDTRGILDLMGNRTPLLKDRAKQDTIGKGGELGCSILISMKYNLMFSAENF